MESLIIEDRVYGSHNFSEPVFVELIESDAVQRLKGIAQFGVPDVWYHKKGFFRFEHDVGVAILLARIGATIEEQIAGLLHDVSHTAFSHVVDYVVGDPKYEDFQDKAHFDVISSDAQIPFILKKYGFDVNDFRLLGNFTLLERPEPELCADRIDYALRELAIDGEKEVVKMCVNGIMAFNGKICFKSKNTAKLFGLKFLDLHKNHWAGWEAVSRYYTLAEALKEALKINLITLEDFRKDDAFLIKKLEASDNSKIREIIGKLLNGKLVDVKGEKKLRYVDPYYIEENKLKKLSENDEEFREKFLNVIQKK